MDSQLCFVLLLHTLPELDTRRFSWVLHCDVTRFTAWYDMEENCQIYNSHPVM